MYSRRPETRRAAGLLSVALLFILLFAGCGSRAPEPAGRIITLKGQVTNFSSAGRAGLGAGAFVFPGTVLVTGKDSFCDVQMRDSVVRVRQESRLLFPPASPGFSGALELLGGKVLVRGGHGSSSGILSVLIPETRIELVDSEAIIEFTADEGCLLTVGRGTASVKTSSPGEPSVLGEGMKAVIQKGTISKKSVQPADGPGLEEFLDLRQEKDVFDTGANRNLRVDTEPGNAEIHLNGSFVGRSPVEVLVPLRRKLSFRAALPGYARSFTNLFLKKPREGATPVLMNLSSVTQEPHPCLLENDSISAEPLFAGGDIYVVEDETVLKKISRDKSGLFHETAFFETGRRINRPVFWEDRILLGSGDGFFYALEAGSLQPAWKKRLGAAENSRPAVENGLIYLGTASGFFYTLDAADGFIKWQFKTLNPVLSSVAVADEMVCFAAADKSLYGLDKATGTMLWRVLTDRPANPVSPSFDADRFFVLTAAGNFTCVNLKGWIVYTKSTRERYARAFLAEGDRIFVGAASGRVHCYDRRTGRLLWKTDLKSPVTSGFLSVRDELFAGLADGRVMKLDPGDGASFPEGRFPGRVKFISYFNRKIYVTTKTGIYAL